ncbi:DUF308 domain-containing protein [Massilia arenae]|uniref:DUF308 domain-containing protein n=1 Tax=Massilia arenae TaxID=2603288 RepID=A0A5C7FZW4_9BURK|nr:DUF308 domain-containing protein [Massilia arenae]TXF96214.1 DUF308 domain-containing protein [Massilia arenae]
MNHDTNLAGDAHEGWLKRYYFVRAVFSSAWVLAVLAITPHSTLAGAVLLVAYPAWDAFANLVDARRSGGLAANRTQLLNVVASLAVALALAVALPDMHRVLAVFGAWAILSGLLQLGTGARRWKTHGAQWAMVLSGAQSALAGAVFIGQARMPAEPTVATVAGYAGFGAFYFLVSALLLQFRPQRRKAG